MLKKTKIMKQNYTIITENQQSLQPKQKVHRSKALLLAFWACCIALIIFLPQHTFAQDGANDPTFNTYDTTNRTRFNNSIQSIALQADGKILVGGQFTTYNGTTATASPA